MNFRATCSACGLLLLSAGSVFSQASPGANSSSPSAVPLPAIQVEGAKKKSANKRTAPKSAKAKSKPTPAVVVAPPPVPAAAEQAAPQNGLVSPKESFVAPTSFAATKTDTPILETPQSISVVTREQLDARDVKTVVEALQYVPGVNVHPGGTDPRFDSYTIRGFDSQGYGAFRDGLREIGSATNFTNFRTEPYGLERVDVIRGPASVLYGQIPPGGLVNSITKRPTAEPVREIVGKIGSNDLFQGAFDLGGAVDPAGVLSFRLTGLFRDSDAQLAHFSDFVPDDRTFIAPSLSFKPNDQTTITILSDYQQDESGNAFPVPTLTLSPTFSDIVAVNALPLYLGDPSYNRFEQEQFRVGYQLEHRFNDVFTVRQGLRYGEIDLDYRYLTIDFAGSGPLFTNFPNTIQDRVAVSVQEQSSSFTVDNQLESKFRTGAIAHTVVTGLDYQRFTLDSNTFGGAAPSLDVSNPVYGQTVAVPTRRDISTDQVAEQLGLYAQDQAKLDNWILTFGGRYDWATVDTEDRLSTTLTQSDDEAFTGRAALSYVFDVGLAPYVSYSESFLPTTGTDFDGNPFDPTTGQQYEAGLKFEPRGSRSRITLAVFDITQQNVLTPDPAPGRIGFNVQTGEVRSRGFEAEAVTNLADGLNLISSYTRLDFEVTEDTDPSTIGKTPVLTPEELTSAFLDYTFPSGMLKGFGFGAGARYVGKSFADPLNTVSNDSYVVADAALHYKLDQSIIALNVSNLFDREETACTTTGGCQFISPRIVTGTVKYRW